MKRSLLVSMLTAMLCLFCITASAYDFKVDGIFYNILSSEERTCEMTEGDEEYEGEIVIPSAVSYDNATWTVTKIGDFAFGYGYNVTGVQIPNTVTSIGNYAFAYCI